MTLFPKTCGVCGVRYLPHTWKRLPFVGVWVLGVPPLADGDPVEVQESRNCPCGATLQRVVPLRRGELLRLLQETQRELTKLRTAEHERAVRLALSARYDKEPSLFPSSVGEPETKRPSS